MKYRPPPVPLLSVGLEMCDLDRPRGDAALPSSPSAEPRTRKGKSSGPCRPAAEARESPRRGWPARGTSTASCLCTARCSNRRRRWGMLGSRRTSPLGLSCSRYHQMLEDGLTSLSSSLRTLVASNLRAVRQRERGSSDEDLNHSVPAAVPPNAMARLPASVMAGTLGYYSL